MKTIYSSGIAAMMIILVLGGCPYESQVPLGDPATAVLDKNLQGLWLSPSSPRDTLSIIRFNDHEYYIESHEIKNGVIITNRGRGFTINVGKDKFLNYNDLSEPQKNYLMKYDITGDRLTGSYPSDRFIEQKFTTSRDLFEFVKKNMNKEGFYEVGDTLVKVTHL